MHAAAHGANASNGNGHTHVHTQTRAVVYAAAGLNATTGQPADCARAGRVRLRAAPAGGGARTSRLSVEWAGVTQSEELMIADTTA